MKNLKALSFGEGLGEAAFVDVYKPAGMYNVQFTMNNLASGVYLFRLNAGDP